MDISLFDFNLPEELISQNPSIKRDESKLLICNKKEQTLEDKRFFNIIDYLKKGDILVRNNTKVLPVRLYGVKKITNAKVEVVLLKNIKDDIWECLVGNAKVVKVGVEISFGNDDLVAKCIETKDEGIRILDFSYNGIFVEILDKIGNMPLPPYIKEQLVSNDRYQTIYAKHIGSSAAPTAGFHFTEELVRQLELMGVEILDITLHIGLGTFRPVKVNNTDDHIMHEEEFEMSAEVATKLNVAKSEGRRIIAVGTTSVRTLEAIYSKYGTFIEAKESTSIFIFPGYTFKCVDAIITNFHLPKSTLIMLVSAFLGREFALKAYEHAIENKYKFFSFGDSSFLY